MSLAKVFAFLQSLTSFLRACFWLDRLSCPAHGGAVRMCLTRRTRSPGRSFA